MHSILDLQHVVLHSTIKKAFKHTSTIACVISIFREDCGRQLLLITNKDYFLWLMTEGYQICQLDSLTCLIDYQILEVAKRKVVEHF